VEEIMEWSRNVEEYEIINREKEIQSAEENRKYKEISDSRVA